MNHPSIQFYPGDWLRDNVSGCSLAAQGLWLRMLILMHDSESYGYLSTNGVPIAPEFIARKCGCDSVAQYATLLEELDAAGIPSRTKQTHIIFSRRMVRDEKSRANDRKRKYDFNRRKGSSQRRLPVSDDSGTDDSDDGNALGTGLSILSSSSPSSSVSSSASPSEETTLPSAEGRPPGRARKKIPVDDHSVLVRYFCTGWSASHQGTKYAFDGGKDGKAVQWLLENAGTLAEAKRVVDAYLADPDPWLVTKGHSLSVLRSQFNAVRGRLSAPAPADPDAFVRVEISDDEADRLLGFAPGTSSGELRKDGAM